MISLKKVKNLVYMLFDKFKFQEAVFYLFLNISLQFSSDIQDLKILYCTRKLCFLLR